MASTSARVVKTRVAFKGPGIQVNGLEAVPEGLWLSDQQTDRTYLVDYEGKVLTSSPARPATPAARASARLGLDRLERPAVDDLPPRSADRALHGRPAPAERRQGGVHGIQWRPYGPNDTVPGRRSEGRSSTRRPRGQAERRPRHQRHPLGDATGRKVIDHIDAETGESLGQIPFPMPRSHGCSGTRRRHAERRRDLRGARLHARPEGRRGDGRVPDRGHRGPRP